MPTRFDFISPGIQLNEVDESQIPSVVSDDTGPVIIGRSLSGPAMKPIKVKNLQDFNEIFGLGISGKGNKNNDVWRDGNTLGPTYAVYAAQAHLASETTPVTFLRLLGEKSADATTDAQYAGWNIANSSNPSSTIANNKSAYGLFILPSASHDSNATGSLAAIFYVNGGSVQLSGTIAGDGVTDTTSSVGTLIKSVGTSANRFTIEVRDASDEEVTKKTIDFTPGSSKYIRNQFNTNPQLLEANKNFGLTNKNYFLGETFEQSVHEYGGTSTTAGAQLGIILALDSGSLNYGDHKKDMLPAKTGWFLNRKSEDNKDGEKLFRLVSLHEGEWLQAGYQVAIKDLTLGNDVEPNSTFTLEIQDKHGNAVEQFSGLNLDPSSEKYIAKAIGDQYLSWDATNTKYNVRGEYTNKSNYVYVEMASAVTSQQLEDAHALPVGCLGPLRPKGFSIVSGSQVVAKAVTPLSGNTAYAHASVVANANVPHAGGDANIFANVPEAFSGSFVFPSLRLTVENANSNGKNFAKTDFQGVRHHRATATTRDDSFIDLVRVLPGNATLNLNHHLGENESLPASHEYSYIFSLDDVVQSNTNSNEYYYESGSYDAGTSYSKAQGSIKNLFQDKVRQFRVPFFGGHDGLDLKEVEPFSNKNLTDKTRQESYAYNSIFKALESVQDPEVVEYNVLAIPGITHTDVTDEVLRVAAERKDHLAIIDIEGGYKPAYESNGSVTTGGINGTITSLEGRKLNTSYAAAYYPWVRLRDRIGGQNDVLYVPPSVAAIGALAKSDKASDLWFAPAGFNRGGINELGGSQGPIITGTWEHLTKDDRDDLYQNNINPIARFPSMDQIVIFGQKTLQQTDSALNRINVRRLLIFLKYRIGLIADTILFDQNVSTTWNRFKSRAERELVDVQNRLGISEFKLVLDEKTTTQDLVDRNIMYAKIFIKPTRSIEFIAVDFIISRSGVEF